MVKVKWCEKTKNWLVLPKASKEGLYFDGFLKQNLDLIRVLPSKDWDVVLVVDGDEGAGKSVMAQQVGFYLDPSLCIKRIAFTPDSFKEAILKATSGQCVIYDDSYSGMSSRGAVMMIHQMLINLMTLMRQKQLFVIIVIPSFHELTKYAAVWRSIALIHVYAPKFERGHFEFYNRQKKKKIYIVGKKTYDYCATPDFKGRFTGSYVVDAADYRKKKGKELSNFDAAEFTGSARFKHQRNSLIMSMIDEGYSPEAVSEFCGRYADEALTFYAINKMVQRERKKKRKKVLS